MSQNQLYTRVTVIILEKVMTIKIQIKILIKLILNMTITKFYGMWVFSSILIGNNYFANNAGREKHIFSTSQLGNELYSVHILSGKCNGWLQPIN